MNKIKRERSANFTLQERDMLVSLVLKYQNVLENKLSDATTWRNKEAAWEDIQREFNARSGGNFRSTKTLKVKYEGLKRAVRKKSAIIRSEVYRTGGGKNTAPPLDNVEQKIKSMISLSIDGLESIYDSDALPHTQSQDGVDFPLAEEFISTSPLPTDTEPEVVENETIQNEVVLIVSNECEPLPSSTEPEEKHLHSSDENDKLFYGTPSGKSVITPTCTNKKWDVTSRRNLKSKRHPALIVNRQTRNAFDELTQAKLDLIKLQKSFLEAEIAEKKQVWEFEENERRKESEFREKERQWKEEEYKLKLQKLRLELKE